MIQPSDLSILYEDNHCLAIDKPAGLLVQGDATGDPTLFDLAGRWIKARHGKPGNVFVGLVHRLDRPVSGVVLLARTSKAASRLCEQFREGQVRKTYLAVAEGRLEAVEGEWRDWLLKDQPRNIVRVVPNTTRFALEAVTAFRVLSIEDRRSALELRPSTGRPHQLRVQLASRGCPIVGDRKYGARSLLVGPDGKPRIALHAQKLVFTHPTRGEVIELAAPVPEGWPDIASASGRERPSG